MTMTPARAEECIAVLHARQRLLEEKGIRKTAAEYRAISHELAAIRDIEQFLQDHLITLDIEIKPDRNPEEADKRKFPRFEYKGHLYTLPQLAVVARVPLSTLRYRLKEGLTVEQAVALPAVNGLRFSSGIERRSAA